MAASRAASISVADAPASGAASTCTENRRPTCPSIRSHAFMTLPVGSAGRAAACRSCPHFTRFASTLRAVPEVIAGPDRELFQIPAQFLRLDRPDGGRESPALVAADVRLTRRRGFVNEPGLSRGAPHAVLFFKLQVGEFQDEFLERIGPGLRARRQRRRISAVPARRGSDARPPRRRQGRR